MPVVSFTLGTLVLRQKQKRTVRKAHCRRAQGWIASQTKAQIRHSRGLLGVRTDLFLKSQNAAEEERLLLGG
jgi:hypothetical protein